MNQRSILRKSVVKYTVLNVKKLLPHIYKACSSYTLSHLSLQNRVRWAVMIILIVSVKTVSISHLM